MSVMSDLQEIFRDVFDDEELVLTAETGAEDIEGWDSYAHIVILSSIQDHFKIEISTKEISGLQTVGDMVRLVSDKRNEKR